MVHLNLFLKLVERKLAPVNAPDAGNTMGAPIQCIP